jgi:hypothetical protein
MKCNAHQNSEHIDHSIKELKLSMINQVCYERLYLKHNNHLQ